MDPDRWRRINDIFQDALTRAADARPPFLVEVCAGDAGLREEVERLVRAHERAAGFLARPALVHAPNVLSLVDLSTPVARQHGTDPVETGFRGTERFTVLRRLGAGGMGVVYAVHDGVRNEAVALKTLRRARPADVSRLKREFRSLADIAHPNIVCLYELVVEPDHCFFTMELVDGLGVSDYVRTPVADAGMGGAEGQRVDAGLVRSVLGQLVAGVSALHGHGKLHRDIKPSNIIVRPDGRVVILDVGLMSDVLPSAAAAGDRLAGTPAYLAPEQHGGADASEASDWYAVGVTLYEAMTGRLPFEGSWDDLGSRKRHSDPPPPASIAPEVPDDLNDICIGLLCRDAYVASFDLNLADMQILKYGTADWEEVLDLEYDDVDGMIYTVGSTHGDMCQAYALGQLYPSVQRISTQVCTAGFKNTSAAANRSNVRFDAYVAAFQWVPGAAHPLKHKAVKQFGADGEDTFNGLALHRDPSGTTRLYVAGKYTPPGRNDMDAKVVRMGVWAAGTTPDAILLNASVETYVRGVPGSTEAAGEIALTDTAAYVVGVRNGALGTHAGPCGDGPDSQLIPRIDRFDHTSPLSPGLEYEYVSTIPMHRTGDVRGIAIDTSANRVIAYGASNYAQGPDEVSFCGDPTSPDYIDNANLGGADENMDQLAATLFHGAL